MGGKPLITGKVCWVERPLNPPKILRRLHGTPRPSGTPQTIRNTESWGSMGSMGEEFGGSHDHYISHDAPWKTKVSTFGD